MHSRTKSVVAKAIRQGYYWPMMHKDAQNIIRMCDDCQVHRMYPGLIAFATTDFVRECMLQDPSTPLIMAYFLALILIVCPLFVFADRVPSVRWTKLVEAILLSASAFLFSLCGTCSIENFLKPLMNVFVFSRYWIMLYSFAMASYSTSLLDALNLNLKAKVNSTTFGFVRMSHAPDHSKHDDPSVNRVHGSRNASSTCISTGIPSLFGLSAMKSARNWSRMDVFGLTALTASLAAQRKHLKGYPQRHPSRIFKRSSVMALGTPVMFAGFQANMSKVFLSKLQNSIFPFSDRLPPIVTVCFGYLG
nr:reverse transcriptase domain-containing protein [Tanacetum cinerariifolium]